MHSVSLRVQRIVVDSKKNQVFIVVPKSKYNESGAFRMSREQLTNLAAQAFLSVDQLGRNIKGATFKFDATLVRKDEEWFNVKTGESGVYTKDHWRITNESIELSPERAEIIENASARVALSNLSSSSVEIELHDDVTNEVELPEMETEVFEH